MANSDTLDRRAPVDLAYLVSTSFGRDDLVARAIDILLDQLPERVADLNQALTEGNWPGLRIAAHSLKPVTGMLGMEPVRDTLRDIETMISMGSDEMSALKELVQDVTQACRQAEAGLSEARYRFAR